MENKDLIAAIITAVSAIASCLAIYYAYLGIKKSQRINYGSLYLNIMDKYSSDEMGISLRKIGSLQKDYGTNFANIWIEAYRSNESWAYDIDYHRRKIKYFYRNLSQLLKYKYIKEDFAETVC